MLNGFSGLNTMDGKPIYTHSYIEQLRLNESKKKKSNYFIAQKGAQEFGLSSVVDIIVFGGNRGGGKANPYSTPRLDSEKWEILKLATLFAHHTTEYRR